MVRGRGDAVAYEAHRAGRVHRRLAHDLRSVGFTAVDDRLCVRVSRLASLPFQLELQLDLEQPSTVGGTLGVDLTIPSGSTAQLQSLFAPGGAGRAGPRDAHVLGDG